MSTDGIRFEAWEDTDGGVLFASTDSIADLRTRGLLSPQARLLHAIESESYEEAAAAHHERMGWEPYEPLPVCANCGNPLGVGTRCQCDPPLMRQQRTAF